MHEFAHSPFFFPINHTYCQYVKCGVLHKCAFVSSHINLPCFALCITWVQCSKLTRMNFMMENVWSWDFQINEPCSNESNRAAKDFHMFSIRLSSFLKLFYLIPYSVWRWQDLCNHMLFFFFFDLNGCRRHFGKALNFNIWSQLKLFSYSNTRRTRESVCLAICCFKSQYSCGDQQPRTSFVTICCLSCISNVH